MSRKATPLENWRTDYALQSTLIRHLKALSRNGRQGQIWGDYKQPKAQRALERARLRARHLLGTERPYAQAMSRELYEARGAAREAAIFASENSSKTAIPA